MKPATLLRPVSRWTLTLGVAAAALAAPAHAGFFEALSSAFRIHWAGTTYRHSDSNGSLRVRVQGKVVFNDAETDVQSLDGRLTVLQKFGGVTRMIDIKADGKGGMTRTYRFNNVDQAIDADAKRWLAEMLPRVAREAGAGAGERVKRLIARGGVAAALDDIAKIESDYARNRHLSAVLAETTLDAAGVERYLELTRKIESDYETKNALTAIIVKQSLAAPAQVAVLGIVAHMDSAFEQKGVMVALSPQLGNSELIGSAWLEAVSNIDSDLEKRHVLEATISKRAKAGTAEVAWVLKAAQDFESDHERASVLATVAKRDLIVNLEAVRAFLSAAKGIDSDFEKARALSALLKHAQLDKAGYAAVIDAARHIDSEFEAKKLLVAIATRMPNDSELVSAYRKAAGQLGDFERREAERALDQRLL